MSAQVETDWRSRTTLTVEEVAPVLGIGRSSAYEAATSGQIPTLRIGRRILIPVPALRRMLGEIDPLRNGETPVATGAPQKTNPGTGGGSQGAG
jgi:excisionase family DNA binding protein